MYVSHMSCQSAILIYGEWKVSFQAAFASQMTQKPTPITGCSLWLCILYLVVSVLRILLLNEWEDKWTGTGFILYIAWRTDLRGIELMMTTRLWTYHFY
jgi:hypothetical protein